MKIIHRATIQTPHARHNAQTMANTVLLERTTPIGPWLSQSVTAIVECDSDEASSIPGVYWIGWCRWYPRPSSGRTHAMLRSDSIEIANAILSLSLRKG